MAMARAEYDSGFYDFMRSLAEPSAALLVPYLMDLFQPLSVIDIGCGDGSWLLAFEAAGVDDVIGVDAPFSHHRLRPEQFIAHDLRRPFSLDRAFDLVLSLEVAEHLPLEAAETFVASLVAAGDLIVFSAAVPGQGGTGHINEQWPAYWARLFQHHEFACHDVLRLPWWNLSVAPQYPQNSLVFARGERIELETANGLPTPPLPLVHPVFLANAHERPEPHLGSILRQLPVALANTVRTRLNISARQSSQTR